MSAHPELPAPPHHYAPAPSGNAYERAEQLERKITELCGHINVTTYRLLMLVLELERYEIPRPARLARPSLPVHDGVST